MSDDADLAALSAAALAFNARTAEAPQGVRMTTTPPRTPPPYDAAGARAICEKATGGDWFADDRGWITTTLDPNRPGEELELMVLSEWHNINDLKFVESARTGWPAALDEIDDLNIKVRVACEQIDALGDNNLLQIEISRLRGLLAEIERIRDLPATNWATSANAMAAKYNLLIDAIDAARIRTTLTPKPQTRGV